MVDERRDVQFPLWRKKVDGSLFQRTIPDWVKHGVSILLMFFKNRAKHPSSKVAVEFIDGKKSTFHEGWVTTTKFGEKWADKRNPVMRFGFDNELKTKLQNKFTMSHMRDLERRMRQCKVY